MLLSILLIPVTIALLALHHFLSTRKQMWLGIIFPVLYTMALLGLIVTGRMEIHSFKEGIFHIIGVGLLIGIWANGRHTVKRKREQSDAS